MMPWMAVSLLENQQHYSLFPVPFRTGLFTISAGPRLLSNLA